MLIDLQKVYNKFALTYDKNRGLFNMTEIINDFYSHLFYKKGKLLDLGCGAGEPFPKFFIDNGWEVTGVDFSENMLEMAEKYVPEMKTIHDDITKVDFKNNEFNAITMIYSFFHLKNEEQISLLSKIYRWLTDDGSILFTYATNEYTGFNEFEGYKEFLGENLFYAHKTPEFLKEKLNNIGFKNILFTYRDIGGETFLWVTADK